MRSTYGLLVVQEELFVRHVKSACLMLDGDEAGQQAAVECLTRLGLSMWARVTALGDSKQPDQLSTDEIRQLLISLSP